VALNMVNPGLQLSQMHSEKSNLQKPEFACRKKYQIEVSYGRNPYERLRKRFYSIAEPPYSYSIRSSAMPRFQCELVYLQIAHQIQWLSLLSFKQSQFQFHYKQEFYTDRNDLLPIFECRRPTVIESYKY